MSDQQQPPESSASTPNSRFAPQNKTVQERVSSSTVGLVNLADFRKRRAEVLEQQHREVREAAIAAARGTGTANPKDSNTDTTSAAATPLLDRSATGTPAPGTGTGTDAENGNGTTTGGEGGKSEGETGKKKTTTIGERKAKRVKTRKALVSFGDEEEVEVFVVKKKAKTPVTEDAPKTKTDGEGEDRKAEDTTENPTTRESSADADTSDVPKKKKLINTSAPIIPRALTKAALRREAAEREAIRKEFLAKQAAVKAAEIAIPFVFYDGTNIPGGMVRVKKGDHAWLFLDKSRKVGAERGVGQDKILNARRAWARVSVDDLLLVRGSIIIPHHYEFYFFIINKTMGPGNKRLFDYSDDAPLPSDPNTSTSSSSTPDPAAAAAAISTPASRLAALPDIMTLEGANDDPTFTKVVDRRWYQRNKHIYPASTWQEFDPEKDYQNEIRRDLGGNAFFFSR
ncbi:hypothetical protein N0V85_006200 [Neurospora sp. IMI 360204]|nr:hypothetical protein N0V85_006200 [Neurospora sp. IMI 360204]